MAVTVTGAGHFHAFQSSPGTATAATSEMRQARLRSFMMADYVWKAEANEETQNTVENV